MRRISTIIKHLKTILVHKFWVFYYCCKLGIIWQGITHDLSKFSLTEFKESIRFFQGGKASPIPVAKREQGYSLAWQHHKGRNPHHYEYWTDNYDSGTTFIKMPYKYVLELVADYLAAGKTYNGKNFTVKQEIDWWESCKDEKAINKETKNLISEIFEIIDKEGFSHLRKINNILKNKYIMVLTIKFNDEGWRIESRNIEGVSDLTLFADGEQVFHGRYGELVEKLKG